MTVPKLIQVYGWVNKRFLKGRRRLYRVSHGKWTIFKIK
jgi:hypothetical protein